MRLLTTESVVKLFDNDFEQTLIKSAYARFNDLNDPLRCNLFSLIARELIRLFLERVAPDSDVIDTEWFDCEVNNGKPTRANRFRYALIGKITNDVIKKYPQLDVSAQCKELVAIIDALSKYAHISQGTVNKDIQSAQIYLSSVEDVIISFCEKYFSVREHVRDIMYEITRDEIDKQLQNEIPSELDELSAGTALIYAGVDKVEDINITTKTMSITGCGSVDVELNYGPNDDGVSLDDNYPFQFVAQINPENLIVENIDIEIDTSSFYE